MSIMDKSIASRIALLLGLFCLVLCAFLISLLQLLKMLSEEADETVNVALPNMAIASYISKESEWAKGILHDSILCRDRFVHLGVVQEIEARRFPENVLESLEALAVDPGVKEKIKNNLHELNGILAGTNQAVAQRIDNLRNTERLVKRIRSLSGSYTPRAIRASTSGRPPIPTCSPPCSCCPCTMTGPIPCASKAKSAPTSNGCCARRRPAPFPGA